MADAGAPLRVGTRGSRLAIRQAQLVVDALNDSHGSCHADLVVIETLGDRLGSAAIARIGEKGVFTRELESALHEGRVDVAVHSLKDLPTEDPAGLRVAAVLEREDAREALVSRERMRLVELPAGARIGTCSLRRRAQLLALRPDLRVAALRGNVPTRVARVERGEFDAALLAQAGLVRLGLEHCIAELLGPEVVLPAPGQGAIAVQARAGDVRIADRLAALDHPPTRLATTAERAFLQALDGGCQTPIAALATLEGERLRLRGLVAELEGGLVLRGEEAGLAREEPEARGLGERLAQRLLERGAGRIVAAARSAAGAA